MYKVYKISNSKEILTDNFFIPENNENINSDIKIAEIPFFSEELISKSLNNISLNNKTDIKINDSYHIIKIPANSIDYLLKVKDKEGKYLHNYSDTQNTNLKLYKKEFKK